ncbi:MAG: NAD-dependent deacylase [Bacteroidota bacterium]
MKKVVVLTGAGISAESGIQTFRESGGLWEKHDICEVATPEAWDKDPPKVLDFYNLRRKQVFESSPNAGHLALVKLEEKYNVQIITQNIDNLHEKAGSGNILHLHGEMMKSQSSVDPDLVHDIEGWELNIGDLCEKGSQLRPHVVWFGEPVPNMNIASEMTSGADILIIIGTSLNVYPAAGLVNVAPENIPKYLIDPNDCNVIGIRNLTFIQEKAGIGAPRLVEQLLNEG